MSHYEIGKICWDIFSTSMFIAVAGVVGRGIGGFFTKGYEVSRVPGYVVIGRIYWICALLAVLFSALSYFESTYLSSFAALSIGFLMYEVRIILNVDKLKKLSDVELNQEEEAKAFFLQITQPR